MTTLITGGNGFIGRHLARLLLDEGRDVMVLDRHGNAPEDGADLYLADVTDANAVTEAMAHASSWVHLAGVLGTQETIHNPRPAAEVNVLGALNVLDAARQYRLPGVMIAVGNHWMQNTYAISKTCAERFAAMYRHEHGLPVTVVRAMNAYGPGQVAAAPFGPSKVRKIVPAFVCRALCGHPLEVYGDGRQVMDMIHVSDVARVLAAALDWTATVGPLEGVVEAGTGLDTTVLDVANEVIRAAGGGTLSHLPMRPGEEPGAVVKADTSAMASIGVHPDSLISLRDGIAETVAWFSANRGITWDAA